MKNEDAQRNPIKYTAVVEKRAIENQHQEHHFFYLYPVFFCLATTWHILRIHC